MILALLISTVAQAAPAAPPAATATTVILVRHAEKADGSSDPGLSAEGAARAEALMKALSDAKLGAVIVSNTKRAHDTAAPVAKAHALTPIEVTTAKGGAAHIDGVVAALRATPAGTTALVVGHSNTLAPIIAALGGPKIAALCEKEFATMYVLETGGNDPKLDTRSYGAADPPDAASCR